MSTKIESRLYPTPVSIKIPKTFLSFLQYHKYNRSFKRTLLDEDALCNTALHRRLRFDRPRPSCQHVLDQQPCASIPRAVQPSPSTSRSSWASSLECRRRSSVSEAESRSRCSRAVEQRFRFRVEQQFRFRVEQQLRFSLCILAVNHSYGFLV